MISASLVVAFLAAITALSGLASRSGAIIRAERRELDELRTSRAYPSGVLRRL